MYSFRSGFQLLNEATVYEFSDSVEADSELQLRFREVKIDFWNIFPFEMILKNIVPFFMLFRIHQISNVQFYSTFRHCCSALYKILSTSHRFDAERSNFNYPLPQFCALKNRMTRHCTKTPQYPVLCVQGEKTPNYFSQERNNALKRTMIRRSKRLLVQLKS